MLREGDKVVARDALCRVRDVHALHGGKQMVSLLPVELNYTDALTDIYPPERIEQAAATALALTETAIGPYRPWCQADLYLELASRKADREPYGARYGRVSLEAYQIAPTLRILG